MCFWKLGEIVPEKKLKDQILGEIVLGEIVTVEKIPFPLQYWLGLMGAKTVTISLKTQEKFYKHLVMMIPL